MLSNAARTVHPRLRGEHAAALGDIAGSFGSSPPARGTPQARLWPRGGVAVHPRLRGEHDLIAALTWHPPGSSPPARGTPEQQAQTVVKLRFIPACAGNTSAPFLIVSGKPVHPRLRGEHRPTASNSQRPCGSSPPARGTPAGLARRTAVRRFIPACAGNTPTAARTIASWSVHPRLRGEHKRGVTRRMPSSGSSPPARGTPLRGHERRGGRRFIPACAGNTQLSGRCGCPTAVHPRLRGEHRSGLERVQEYGGSSPPARGTHALPGPGTLVWRFIPACAGNTPRVRVRSRMGAVHPRLRGEHDCCSRNSATTRGSSPPARGTLFMERVVPQSFLHCQKAYRAIGCFVVPGSFAFSGRTLSPFDGGKDTPRRASRAGDVL